MHRLRATPPLFHSEETDLPFSRCNDCGGALETSEDGHIIQKVIRRGETIMEIAVCTDCQEKLQTSYSAESSETIWNFYLDHGDLPNRLAKFAALPATGPDQWLHSCVTCGSRRDQAEEYVIAAQCIDDRIIYGELPLMMCGKCLEQIVESLSAETRETYDRWIDHCFPPDPSLSVDPPRHRLFI